MGITTGALSVIAANMTGSSLPSHSIIGIGSTAYVSGNTILVSQFAQSAIDFSDLTAAKEVTFNTTFSPTEVSGLSLREFGTRTTGSVLLNREVLAGSVVFDGEEELTIQQTYKFYL